MRSHSTSDRPYERTGRMGRMRRSGGRAKRMMVSLEPLEPLFENITNNQWSILFGSWLPPREWRDPVLWR